MSPRRPWARPLVPLYAAGLQLARIFARKPRRLAWPVISVGSLSAGGAGKTPVVIALVQMLRDAGWQPVVLSRGYGRTSSRSVERVDAAQEDAAARFGDEPTLIAQRSGAPVWVGGDRYRAGLTAQAAHASFTRPIFVLDDGMQHRHLARALELVLVTAEDLDDVLLPAGNLREPHSALQRADAVIVREEEADDLRAALTTLLPSTTPIWCVRRSLTLPLPLRQLAAGLRPIAFCALARPESFRSMLLRAGVGLIETAVYHDHHTYREREVAELCAIARSLGATGYWTTEKDAVKLSPALRAQLEQVGPLAVAALEADLLEPEAILRTIERAAQKAAEVTR